ncbi:Imm71 family immunity protein [Duganella aceris]|uniref:Imm71 family immunity protein n=1 Tax=Duganella aceris TaxID=2703883 RepID=UPI001E4C880F|nr:Imm71 family immunity protein [Duganella aceris]
MLPTDVERQQIFYFLQRLSSVTAWRRIFEYYKAWADCTENSVREADRQGWADRTGITESDYVLILKGLAHCEEGVVRLGKGDKRVFKFDANGEFEMASRTLSHWASMKTRIEEGENGIDEPHTPLWTEFKTTLTALNHAWQECSHQILEPRYVDEPALTMYNSWLQDKLKAMPFPSVLPTVPDPLDNTFVRTNEYTPFSGIWEPIEAVPKKTSLLRLFSDDPKPQPPFKIMGAMNYLLGGSRAPQIDIETAEESMSLDTTWRLLWRDDRYDDGRVPEQEQSYRFMQPKTEPAQNSSVALARETMWGESGSAVPSGGTWLLEFDLTTKIVLQKGQKLPLHQGREVRWVLAESRVA